MALLSVCRGVIGSGGSWLYGAGCTGEEAGSLSDRSGDDMTGATIWLSGSIIIISLYQLHLLFSMQIQVL